MAENKSLWLLGASDPEMAAIERLLTSIGETTAHAVGSDGQRVHPGNAYRAIGYRLSRDDLDLSTRWDGPCYQVECGGDLPPDAVSIDHHRPGDPGYGRPTEEFLSASSVGQVYCHLAKLGKLRSELPWMVRGQAGQFVAPYTSPGADDPNWWVYTASAYIHCVPKDVVFTAAADHCLEPAYRGRCLGVDPDELMAWRVRTRAAFQNRSVSDVSVDVEAARKRLRACVELSDDVQATPTQATEVGGGPLGVGELIADLRGESIPELPEAAAREGIPFLATVKDRDGREKVILQAAPPELIRRFLAGEIVPNLVGMYGDPLRGLCGGYLA